GPVAVAQADAGVAADDDVPLDDAVAAVVPQEHRPPGLRRPPADAPEDVVADDPAAGRHGVDAAEVVAVEVVGPVLAGVGKALGSVVEKEAVADAAVAGGEPVPVPLRDGRRLDGALPGVADDAVVQRHAVGPLVGVDLEGVPADVLEGEVGYRHAGAAGD